MTNGPIVLIDDDRDDINFLKDALTDLRVRNEIIAFNNANDALNFFETSPVKPFFVLCDINMPEVDGIELRKMIYNNPRLWRGTFPFLFLSTGGGGPVVNDAYNMTVQGYFIKPSNLDEIEELLKSIISYWSLCQHPTNPYRISDQDFN